MTVSLRPRLNQINGNLIVEDEAVSSFVLRSWLNVNFRLFR
jgi:hypothetical protein